MMKTKKLSKIENKALVYISLFRWMILKSTIYKKLNFNTPKAAIFVWLLLVFINPAFSQQENVYFEHITVEKGLSQSSVLSIAQDSIGFMWFGTKDGLSRYDSRQFEVYRYNPQDKSSISSSLNINALLTDSKGNLWVGTQNGLNKYLPESNSFIRFQHDSKRENTISNNAIRCIYEDRQNNIWIGTDSGLNKLVGGQYFERFISNPGNGIANNIVKAIYQDQDHTMWIGTQNGLTSMVLKNNGYRYKTYLHNDKDNNSLAANDINSIAEDLNHNLWIGTHFKGLDLYDKTTSTFKHFTQQAGDGLSSNVIRKIRVLKDGKLWIATLNGINVYDPVNRKFRVYQHDPENPGSLNQNSIYDIFQDAAGSVWAGTYYGGINVYHANVIPFKTYKHYSYKNSLSSNIISAIVEDSKGNLWIGTEAEGLNYYDRATGRFTNFKSRSANVNSLSSNLIKAISLDKNGDVWIAAYEGGLDFYSPKTGKFKNYKLSASKHNSLASNRITSLLNDKKGRLWIGSRNGLYRYNSRGNSFISLLDSNENNHLAAKTIHYIFQDTSETIWVSTGEGVFYLKKDTEIFRRINFKKNKTVLNNINSIQQDNKGKIWFGSYNEGLVSFHPITKVVNIYTTAQGLPANNITGIVEDNEGYLWISTDKGLAKLDSGHFKVYTRKDGLPGNVFNYNSFLKDSKGELFFGGYNGMVSFLPENIKENKKAPEVVFTGLKLFNKTVNIDDDSKLLSKSISRTSEIVLSYDQNVFSIDFSVLNYIKSGKNKYAYKLEGFENGWNFSDYPNATYTNLPDGKYTLLIKGANNDGVWSKEAVSLAIKIQPPFWLTWWAYIIYAFFAAGLLFIIVRFLLIRALLKREHDIHQIKLDFFTNVSHEIRTPLTLILGPLEKLIQDTQESRSINRSLLGVNKNVKRLLRLVNELMDFRKIESGKTKLNITADNLVNFAKEIYLSFQHLAIQRKIKYRFICEYETIEVYFDRDQLEKVVFNLLSNAFKFVPENGEIILEITNDNGNIALKVYDNGPGIPIESRNKLFTDFYQAGIQKERNAGTGIGLALSKRIALLHHGNLILEEATDKTCFCLTLKTGSSHFKSEELKDYIDSESTGIYELQSEVDAIIYPESLLRLTASSFNKPSILVTDDNFEVRDFIVKALTNKYSIIEAENGAQALALATEKIPDLIISDVMMPVMDGFEFCRKIKTDERTSHIPVILLTARSGEIHELDGLRTGADIYLTKPFSIRKLQLNVENLLLLHDNMRNKFSRQFTLQPSDVVIESHDEEFLNKVLQLLEVNISNPEFNVNQFAAEIGMSTPVFYKKIKALTGLTVNNFVKSIRLKRAVQLLEQNAGTIYEIAYMVGFNDAKYFSKEFRKQYGQSPSEIQK